MDSPEVISASLRAAENLHFDAATGLEEAALDFYIAHIDIIEAQAEAGCGSAQDLVDAVDDFFRTFEAMDRERIALVDAEWRR